MVRRHNKQRYCKKELQRQLETTHKISMATFLSGSPQFQHSSPFVNCFGLTTHKEEQKTESRQNAARPCQQFVDGRGSMLWPKLRYRGGVLTDLTTCSLSLDFRVKFCYPQGHGCVFQVQVSPFSLQT